MSIELPRKATLREVADKAGVSLATVDRVISERARVSPHTRDRVLSAIAELRDEEELPGKVQNTGRRRYAFILESGSAFLESIGRVVDQLRPVYAERGVDLVCRVMADFDLKLFLEMLQQAAEECDGIVLLAREDISIVRCVNDILSSGTPVVTFTSDLNDTYRLAYAGCNNISAGRTAGQLMGRLTGGREGEVIMLISAPYLSQYERETGFRGVMRHQFPALTIRESLNNQDLNKTSYQSLMQLFDSGIKPPGIYNTTGGIAGVGRALLEKGWEHEVAFICHELNDESRPLLEQGVVDAVIDQDLVCEAMLAAEVLQHRCGRRQNPVLLTPCAPVIVIKENLAARNSTGLHQLMAL